MMRIDTRLLSSGLALLLCWGLPERTVAGEGEGDGQVRVQVELVTPRVFVDEFLVAYVTVTAPRERAVEMIRPDLFWGEAAEATLFDPEGEWIPNRDILYEPPVVKPTHSQMTLDAGRRIGFPLPLVVQPRRPGLHRLELTVRVDGWDAPRLKYNLTVLAVPLDESTIVERIVLKHPKTTMEPELLIAKDGANRVLLHRNREERRIKRLAELHPDSRVSAVANVTNDRERWGVIGIQLIHEDTARFMSVDYWYGSTYWPRAEFLDGRYDFQALNGLAGDAPALLPFLDDERNDVARPVAAAATRPATQPATRPASPSQ